MIARSMIRAALLSLLLVAGALLAAPLASAAEESCPNAASRQGPSVALPDCRVYEQVTPVDKGDNLDLFTGGAEAGSSNAEKFEVQFDGGYSSENGDKFMLANTLSSLASAGAAELSSYVFSRGADGWSTSGLTDPGAGVQSIRVSEFNSSLSAVVFDDRIGSSEDVIDGDPSAFALDNLAGPVGGPYSVLTSEIGDAASEESNKIAGASADMSHVLIEKEGNLYDLVGGQTQMVDVSDEGTPLPCGGALGDGMIASVYHTWADGGTHNAVSENGSKILFESGCTTSRELYMRMQEADGTMKTVEISAPNAGVKDPTGPHPAVYVGASANDSKVFFLTEAELTSDDTTHAPELYEYDSEAPEGQRLMRISSGDSGTAEGNVDFIPAVSDDGSAVYFAALSTLAPGAVSGECNLYRYDTDTRHTTFIAPVGCYEYPLTSSGENISPVWYEKNGGASEATSWGDRQTQLPAQEANWYATGNGQYLLFASQRPLTGYNAEAGPGGDCKSLVNQYFPAAPGCVELFRYSAQAEANKEAPLVCVSCGPPGSHPSGRAEFIRSVYEDEAPSVLPPRPISEDGSYAFFDTPSALTPNASSEKLQVYEWHDGRISLISPAGESGNSWFEGSSADGSNAFFGTHAQLAPQDTDQSGDLYDARIDGGFVGLAPTACTGTGCQGVPAAPPIFATPASVTFEGIGNFSPAAVGTVTPKRKSAAQIKAEKLANALKTCKSKAKSKRRSCERAARKRYGVKSKAKAKKSNRRGK